VITIGPKGARRKSKDEKVASLATTVLAYAFGV